jgi:hypothetical protein
MKVYIPNDDPSVMGEIISVTSSTLPQISPEEEATLQAATRNRKLEGCKYGESINELIVHLGNRI